MRRFPGFLLLLPLLFAACDGPGVGEFPPDDHPRQSITRDPDDPSVSAMDNRGYGHYSVADSGAQFRISVPKLPEGVFLKAEHIYVTDCSAEGEEPGECCLGTYLIYLIEEGHDEFRGLEEDDPEAKGVFAALVFPTTHDPGRDKWMYRYRSEEEPARLLAAMGQTLEVDLTPCSS